MSNPMIRIHNVQTDKVIDREMTDEEFAALKKTKLEIEALAKADAEKAEAKKALLDRLGITEAEARLLLS
jgi:hypothetical protein